ncbi:hypothetical protein YC2023_018224 [Brassica napus]
MLLVEKTVISLLIETSANQDTKYNDNHRILEAFFDIWLVVSCKWIGQEKSLTFTEIIFMELLQCLQGTRSICWEKTGEAFWRDDADDDDNPDGIPVPVQVETGEGSSDAVKDADEKADDHAPKKRIHSSTNAAKIVHILILCNNQPT